MIADKLIKFLLKWIFEQFIEFIKLIIDDLLNSWIVYWTYDDALSYLIFAVSESQ